MHITFIGGGNMGEAIMAALLRKKVVAPDQITVSDVNAERLDVLYERYGVNTTGVNAIAIAPADVIVLAVKPQVLDSLLAELKGKIKTSQLVLSIIAGARIEKIRRGLAHKKIIRSMPNTPAQIGEGMTVWTATPEVTRAQKGSGCAILRVMGQEIEADDEKYLDMATAVSGSGPAYVFYFVESMIEAAVKLGFSREQAEKLVRQTVTGSVHLLQKSDKTPADLRKAVTSPGGTTFAAITQFEKDDFQGIVFKAVEAAHNRAKELGGK
jgi:pyrroline-5-carboxylate reductase